MKKKSAAKTIEDLDCTLVKIATACEVYRTANSCPEHMKIWFESIEAEAKRGLEH